MLSHQLVHEKTFYYVSFTGIHIEVILCENLTANMSDDEQRTLGWGTVETSSSWIILVEVLDPGLWSSNPLKNPIMIISVLVYD